MCEGKYAQNTIGKYFSNLEKIKSESVWSDETQRWKVPELVVQKTKLPPAGKQQENIVIFKIIKNNSHI